MGVEFDPAATARQLFEHVPWRRYVALGDSTTEGLGDPYEGYPDVGWTQMVADALREVSPGLEFLNLGVRYLTTREIRERQLDRAIAAGPDIATVVAGGNDMLRERFDPGVCEQELDRMVSALLDAGADVVTCTMFDIFSAGLLNEQMTELLQPRFLALNDAVRRVAERHAIVLVDIARDPISGDRDAYSSDLQHTNRRGHAAAAELVLKALARARRGAANAQAL